MFLYVGAEVSFGGWIFTFARTLKLGSETSAAYLTSVFWGALTAGRLVSIPIAMRFKPRTILIGSLAGSLVFISIILIRPEAIWLGTIGFGLSMSSIFPTMLAFAGKRMKINGKITGYFFVGASVGAMSLPWLIGQLFESVGPVITMIAILVNLVLSSAMFVVLILYSLLSCQAR